MSSYPFTLFFNVNHRLCREWALHRFHPSSENVFQSISVSSRTFTESTLRGCNVRGETTESNQLTCERVCMRPVDSSGASFHCSLWSYSRHPSYKVMSIDSIGAQPIGPPFNSALLPTSSPTHFFADFAPENIVIK